MARYKGESSGKGTKRRRPVLLYCLDHGPVLDGAGDLTLSDTYERHRLVNHGGKKFEWRYTRALYERDRKLRKRTTAKTRYKRRKTPASTMTAPGDRRLWRTLPERAAGLEVKRPGRVKKNRWMQRAFADHKRGSLHRYLRVPVGQKIPVGVLREAERRLKRDHAVATGARRKKLLSRLREVRLALTTRRVARERKSR